MTTTTQAAKVRQPGWWYPLIFVAVFVVVVAVNGTMAFFATSTFSGISTDNAYEKGLAYNRNIAMAKAQAEMGWQMEASIEPATGTANDGVRDGGHRGTLAVRYRDRDGHPIDGLDVHVILSRPTVKGYEREVVLTGLADGRYSVPLDLPLAGEWDGEVTAIGTEVVHQSQHRFVLP